MVFEINELSYSYGDRKAVDRVSLFLEPGCFYAVLGPNGCGKTTLMDLMCRHKKADSGSIVLNGRPLETYSSRALARQVALVPQEYRVNFPYTAKEVVAMARYPHLPRFSAPAAEDMKCVASALSSCGADELADRFMTELSGGEKQRVVFARALAQQTRVLLLDEPCANLDIRHALLLLDTAHERVKKNGATVVAVMHDINLALRYADRLILMERGRIAAGGPLENTLEPGILKQVFGVNARVRADSAINAPQVTFVR
ncbi:MAG: ABC transporter ATP-binding protein [Thermodesulfobacteriota bacterium]